jgi:hypothetical protein
LGVHYTFGHADLLRHFNNLDLDVDLDKRFRERVDLDETRVDSASETTELGDETNVSLLDGLVRVRAAETARNGSESTDGRAEGVDLPPYQPVPEASSVSGLMTCAYDGWRSSRRGG